MFAAAMVVAIGDGATASFWFCSWLGGRQLCLAYPTVFACSFRKNISVREALQGDRWILDLRHDDYDSILHLVVQLAREIRNAGIVIEDGRADEIRWALCSSGQYSARSSYNAQFADSPAANFRATIWNIWAPGKIKLFLWMLNLDKLWCNNRLQRHGCENSYFYQLCLRNLETSVQLLWECPIAIQAWNKAATWTGFQALAHGVWSTGKTTADRV